MIGDQEWQVNLLGSQYRLSWDDLTSRPLLHLRLIIPVLKNGHYWVAVLENPDPNVCLQLKHR